MVTKIFKKHASYVSTTTSTYKCFLKNGRVRYLVTYTGGSGTVSTYLSSTLKGDENVEH